MANTVFWGAVVGWLLGIITGYLEVPFPAAVAIYILGGIVVGFFTINK